MQPRVPTGFVTLRSNGAKMTIDIGRVVGFRDDPDGGTEVWLQGKGGQLHIDDGHDQFGVELVQAKERVRDQLKKEMMDRLGFAGEWVESRLNLSVFRAIKEYDPADNNRVHATSDGIDATTKDGNTRLKIEQLEPSEPPKPMPAGVAEVRRTVRHSVARYTQDAKDAAAAGYDEPRFVVQDDVGNFLTDSGAADHSGPPRLFTTRTEAHSLASVASLRFPENAWRVLSLAEAESEARRPRADDPDVLSVIGCALSLVKAIEKDPAACSQLVQDMATGLRVELDHFINVFDDAKAKPAAQHTA